MRPLFKLIFSIVASTFMCSCEDNKPVIDYLPISEFVVSPDTGNTTTIFTFDASESLKPGIDENPVFLRWDWDNDGNFDKMYTSGGTYTHRFFAKGTYTVVLESATLLGRKDTSSITLRVIQGYSPPRAGFIIFPDSANIFTEFVFDASLSKDDEDSLDQLLFRWDFDGDETWDTEFSPNHLVSHTYTKDRHYPVRLEVIDPQQMTGTTDKNLIVTRLNDKIKPQMTYECWPCTLEDTIRFNAEGSFIIDDQNAELRYSWDIFSDGKWEKVNGESPLFSFRIPFEGIHNIKLRATDMEGLYMDTVYEIEIFPYNTPPITELVLGNPFGNTSTEYYMHGLTSWDRETSYFNRKLQWDLNGDGIWEEEHNDKYELTTTYDQPGTYPVRLRITDEQGKYTDGLDTVYVFDGSKRTALLEDPRGGAVPTYYGTVLIGDTWWTQNNSKYLPPQGPPTPPGSYSVDSYYGDMSLVSRYGYLYPYSSVNSKFSPCPDGWRIPTVKDWEKLMEELAPNNSIPDLLFGGSSELHLFLTGQYDLNGYSGRNRMVHYYTTDGTPTGLKYIWYIDKVLNKNKSVLVGRTYRVPMRCVKNN